MSEARKDAAGREIAVGNIVGGTTSGRYQETIIGPALKFHKYSVTVEVTNTKPDNGYRPSNGEKVRIDLSRVFFVREEL